MAIVKEKHPLPTLSCLKKQKNILWGLQHVYGPLLQAYLVSQFNCGLKKFNLKGRPANG